MSTDDVSHIEELLYMYVLHISISLLCNTETIADPALPSPTEEAPHYQHLDDIIREVTSYTSIEELRATLEDSIMLYILDTGGQPEYLQVLPSLLTGPAINIIMFKANESLQERYSIRFISPDGTEAEPYLSEFTSEEAIMQALASMSYRAPPMELNCTGTVQSTNAKSATLFVSTHRDLASPAQLEAAEATLHQRLDFANISSTRIFSFPAGNPGQTSLILPVISTDHSDPAIEQLRATVNDVIDNHFDHSEIPVTWLFFQMAMCSTGSRMISLQECAAIGLDYGIEDEELKLALWFLSHQRGIFRYYHDLTELRDVVFCDIGIVFEAVSKLISSTFRVRQSYSRDILRFQRTGRCPISLAEVLMKDCCELPFSKLSCLLQHLHIFSLIPNDSGEDECFLPCVLRPYEIEEMQWSSSDPRQPSPLLFRFESVYCPTGIFHSLCVLLSSRTHAHWRLYDKEIYRNLMTFRVGELYHQVTLILRPTYFEIWVDLTEDTTTNTLEACSEIHSTLGAAIEAVKYSLNSSQHVNHQTAFLCQILNCDPLPHPATIESEMSKRAECCLSKKTQPISPQQRFWLGSNTGENCTCIYRYGIVAF